MPLYLPSRDRLVASLDTTSSNIANTETIVFQYRLPAGLLQAKDRLRLSALMTKSGTTDTGVFKIRVGSAGTTSDTQILSSNLIAAGNRSAAQMLDLRLESATSLLLLATGTTSGINGYSSVSSAAPAAAVTITDAIANSLYFSVSINSSSTNDTVALVDAQLRWVGKVN